MSNALYKFLLPCIMLKIWLVCRSCGYMLFSQNFKVQYWNKKIQKFCQFYCINTKLLHPINMVFEASESAMAGIKLHHPTLNKSEVIHDIVETISIDDSSNYCLWIYLKHAQTKIWAIKGTFHKSVWAFILDHCVLHLMERNISINYTLIEVAIVSGSFDKYAYFY